MSKRKALVALMVVLVPRAGSAQDHDVARRAYTFLDDRLTVHVVTEAAGELQVVRGERGRVEVAARSRDGFPGFGLGGDHTRELRLTAVGAERVQYLVVVPEDVRVTIRLPGGGTTSLAMRAPGGSYRWEGSAKAEPVADALPLQPTTGGGLFVAHAARWAPAVVDVPDLGAIRSLAVRFEGGEFRVAASRPLSVSPGDGTRLELRLSGEPVDVVLYVPRGNATFQLRSGAVRLAEWSGGRAHAVCGSVVIQQPTPSQDWLTFYPQAGRPVCR